MSSSSSLRVRGYLVLLVYLVAAAASQSALAQGKAASASDGLALEEVVVTARKRSEELHDVPISITAFNAAALESRGIESIYDLAMLTPNLSFAQSFGRVFDRPVIRGQSQILGERTVSYVVDGVYIAGSLSGSDLDDLESVEVLKGPQAANYGRGSLAGVISYRTRKPSADWRGSGTASYGDDGYNELAGNVSGPVFGEKLTFKLGARYYNYDGQYTGISSDGRTPTFGAERSKRVSGALRWQPTDDIDVTVRAFGSQNTDGPYPYYNNPTLNCFTTAPAARGGSFCGKEPEISRDGVLQIDLADIERVGRPGIEADTFLYSAEANWKLGTTVLTGLVSWNRQDEDWIIDNYVIDTLATTRSTVPSPTLTIANPGNVQRVTQVREYRSQELRLASKSESRLQWMVGAYHFDQEFLGSSALVAYNINLANGMAAPTNTGPVGTIRVAAGIPAPTYTNNEAVFGSLGFDLTDRWHLGFEGRYSRDELTTNNATQVGGSCARVLNVKYSSFTPRGTAIFDLTPDANVYVSVARGNKPGDFNTALCGATIPAAEFARLSTVTPLAVKEEQSLNYELGTKLRLLDGRMSLDAAVFFTDWTDQQISQSQVYTQINGAVTNTSLIGNAGKTEVQGIELSWRWKLSRSWDLNAAYGYAKAEFQQLCDATYAQLLGSPVTTSGPCPSAIPNPATPATATNFADVSGFRTANSPLHTGSVGAEFRMAVRSDWSLFARSDFSYQSERFAEVYNHASTGDSTRLDARLGLETEAWKVTLWGRNLADDRSPSSVRRITAPNAAVPLTRAYDMFMPNGRQFGVTANYRF